MSLNLTLINIDKVAQICFETFQKVPKSGKPAVNEWTVLSCILIYDKTLEKIEVISLGTGTKCVGASKMSSKGDILNDSHAEAMARRGFLLYLYENVEKALENQKSIFYLEDEQLKLRDDIEFVFYSSHVPCGDAAIVLNEDYSTEDTHEQHKDNTADIFLSSKNNSNSTEYISTKLKLDSMSSMFDDNKDTNKMQLPTESSIFLNEANSTEDILHTQNSDFANIISTNKESNSPKNLATKHKLDSSTNTSTKKPKLPSDIHRTGAKCLPNSEQDPLGTYQNYHITGQVRTKPGRGPRTLSVSCTDKIARWIHLGIQGSLLTLFIEPIFIKHFIFGGGVPYCEESIKRAFFNRNGTKLELNCEPKFFQSTLVFEHLKSDVKCRPSPASIVWIKLETP